MGVKRDPNGKLPSRFLKADFLGSCFTTCLKSCAQNDAVVFLIHDQIPKESRLKLEEFSSTDRIARHGRDHVVTAHVTGFSLVLRLRLALCFRSLWDSGWGFLGVRWGVCFHVPRVQELF